MANGAQELELQIKAKYHETSNEASTPINTTQIPVTKHYRWWLRVAVYIIFLLAGQATATLLGGLYYDEGGNSKWMATFVQSAGFPILIPILLFTPPSAATAPPPATTLLLLYLFFGLLLTGDNLMYSYGLLYLPVSTYSLICATQLAFNAVFSYLFNSQKFTALIVNSLFLLTVSAALVAVNSDSDNSSRIPKGKYIIGFFCTLGASAGYSLYLSLLQVSFEKILKTESFRVVLELQIYPSMVAAAGSTVGLFASGEWSGLRMEMDGYKKGSVSYVMTLLWTAVAWQICSVGILGLIYEVSSLFTNVISTLGLPVVPVLAVVFFGDKMDGVKAIALVVAVWGSVSYVYQHYLDDLKLKAKKRLLVSTTNDGCDNA